MYRKEGIWGAIDGRDAVGKSSQVPKVGERLRNLGVYPVTELTEFSNSPAGMTILDILQRNRFYSLHDEQRTPLADTVHLLSDMMYHYETEISPTVQQGGIAVSDRGGVSFVAYQGVRVAERSPRFNVREAIDWTKSLAQHCLVIPDFTALIRISEAELKRRVVMRGEEPLSERELDFLDSVDRVMLATIKDLSKEYAIIDGEQPMDVVTDQLVDLVWSRYNR